MPVEPNPSPDASKSATMPTLSAAPVAEQATLAHVSSPPDSATLGSSNGAPAVAVPGYELLAELGHGGMGVVYKARQTKLNRLVALKMILAGSHAGAAAVTRFQIEAEAIARLQHPNIVQVYEVGEHDSQPFLSLEYCGGGSLKDKLNGTPLPPREVAALVETLARAMQAAHAQRIVHRDLKPANVLLTDEGVPKITDFGLAKKMDEASQTHSGAILGTPSYMAPEQAGSSTVPLGPSADVYALGAILYECLTGRPPFKAATTWDTLAQVVNEEPVPPARLQSRTPRDLETICLKCLQKEPRKRYASAQELADDLRRFLDGEPIRARPVGRMERAVKWVRRKPAVASLLILVVVVTALSLALVSWKWREAEHQRDQTDKHRQQIQKQAEEIQIALDRVTKANEEAAAAQKKAEGRLYGSLLSEARMLRVSHREGWREDAFSKLLQAGALKTPQRDLAVLRGEAIACAGGFDAHRVAKLRAAAADRPIWSVDFSPDGTRLATADGEGTVKLWKITAEGIVLERMLKDPKADIKKLYYPLAPLPAVAFHPSGRYLAYTTWNCSIAFLPLTADTAPLQPIAAEVQPRSLSFDAAGATLAVSWIDGQIVVYKFPTAEKVRTFQTPGRLESFQWMPVALSPDGKKLAAIGANHAVVVYPLDSDGPPVTLGQHRDKVQQLCFSMDGKRLASASHDHTAKIWSVDGKAEPITLLGHSNRIHGLAFSPDGEMLATASDDQTARIWEVRSGQPMIVLRPENETVLAVRFSPDSRRLATARTTLALYQLTDRREQRSFAGHNYTVDSVSFHPRLPVLASSSSDKDIILWDLTTGQPARRFRGHNSKGVLSVAFSPDGAWLAAGHVGFYNFRSTDHDVRMWNAATGQEQSRFRGPTADVLAVAFHPSSKQLAAGATNGRVYLWDIDTEKAAWQTNDLGGAVLGLIFLDEGNQLMVGLATGNLQLLNSGNGKVIRTIALKDRVSRLALAPGGKRLAVASADGAVRILKAVTFEVQAELSNAHLGPILAVAFSPDGRLLASAGEDRIVRLWNAETLEKLCMFPAQNSPIRDLAFSPDGTFLAIAGVEEQVTVWDMKALRKTLAELHLDWE